MAKRSKSSSGGSVVKKGKGDELIVDFGEMIEGSGGGNKRYPEGDYAGKILVAKRDKSSNKGTPCVSLKIRITYPEKYAGKDVYDNLWLTPKSLPRLADLLEILGVKVPKREVSIPLKKLKGKLIGFSLEDEEGNDDKMRSRLAWDFLDPEDVMNGSDDEDDEDDDLDDDDEDDDDLDDDDEDDEDEDDDEDDEDDDEDEEDLDDMDLEELLAYAKSNKIKVPKAIRKKESKVRKHIESELDDDDEDDDDEDDLDELDLDNL